MLTARPVRLGSWSFVVEDERQREVAAVELRRMADEGTVRVADVPFALEKAGRMAATYTLLFEGVAVASAERSGLFRPRFQVRVEAGLLGSERPLTVDVRPSWSGRTYRVTAGGRPAGEVRRRGLLRREAVLTLPADLPLGVQAFLLALVLVEWRRAARSG